jgi:hypothetical protein
MNRADRALAAELKAVDHLHDLAARCANAVLAIQYLRYCMDGERHAGEKLRELGQTVGALPELPLATDPFSGDAPVTLAGEVGTSAHAALFRVAFVAWRRSHVAVARRKSTTRHTDQSGTAALRVTTAFERVPPTAVEWTTAVWQSVREGLGKLPDLCAQDVQTHLALEYDRAARRIEQRYGVVCGLKTNSQRTTGAKHGRPVETNPEADRRVYDSWRSGQYTTYQDLARQLNVKAHEVKKVIDRHRKRLRNASE